MSEQERVLEKEQAKLELELELEEAESEPSLISAEVSESAQAPPPRKRKPSFRGPGKKRVVSIIGVQPKPKPELKQVIVRVPLELREKWKLACQSKQISMQQQVVRAMNKWASWALKEDLTGWDEELLEKVVGAGGAEAEVGLGLGLGSEELDPKNPQMILLPVNSNDSRLWGKTKAKLQAKVVKEPKPKGRKPKVAASPGQTTRQARDLAKEQARLELMARASDWCWPCGEIHSPTRAEREVGGLGAKVKWIDESGRFYDDELEQVQANGMSSPELQVGAGRLRWERTIWPGLVEGWRPRKGSKELVWSRVRYVLAMMERELGQAMPRELGRGEGGLLGRLEAGELVETGEGEGQSK